MMNYFKLKAVTTEHCGRSRVSRVRRNKKLTVIKKLKNKSFCKL